MGEQKHKTLIRIVGVPAETRTWYIPNMSQKHHRLTNLVQGDKAKTAAWRSYEFIRIKKLYQKLLGVLVRRHDCVYLNRRHCLCFFKYKYGAENIKSDSLISRTVAQQLYWPSNLRTTQPQVKIYTTNYKKICQSVENALGRVNAIGTNLSNLIQTKINQHNVFKYQTIITVTSLFKSIS